MIPIRFKHIPHDRSLDGTRYEKILRAEDFERMRGVSPSGVSFLLNEAIHFYNYGLNSLMAHMVVEKNKSWTPFDSDTVAKGIEDLYQVSREALIQTAKNLALMRKGKPVHLPGQVNDEARGWKLNSANVGMLAASLWISDKYRNEKKVRLLGGYEANKVYFRQFEELPDRIKSMRSFFDKSLIEKQIGSQYSRFITGGIEEYLFEPFWGGSAVIRYEGWNDQSPDPLWPYPHDRIYRNTIGSTEKLYHDAAFDIFAHPKTANPPPDRFLSEVDIRISELKKILPFYLSERRLRIWHDWDQNLYLLEQIFLDAVNYTETVYGAKRHLGVFVGLPCAFGFIGLLRAYIADLMGRTLMVAFSHAIMPIYENINGYMAVQLWEALTDKEVPSVKSAGALLGLEVELKRFRRFPVSSWVKKVPEEERAVKLFEDKLNAPLIEKDEYRKKAFYVQQVVSLGTDVTFDDWHMEYLPYYPVITSDFYKLFGLERNKGRELLYGSRFTAQAHIYIAFKLLAKGLSILELDKDFDKTEQNRLKKGYKKHRRHLKNFRIGAGSYIWGGKKPPHRTHRHGINFDFSFGPNIPAWQDTKFTEAIKKLRHIKKLNLNVNGREISGRQLLKSIIDTDRKKYGFLEKNVSVVIVCYTNKQGESSNQRRKAVFKRLVQSMNISEPFSNVHKFCTFTIEGKSFDTSAEAEAYQKAEQKLIGTPHFMDPDDAKNKIQEPRDQITELSDWQRTHIAHLALMLAAPRTMIFVSPIVHLRSMRAIRQTFSADGFYLFSVNCTDDLVEELDALHRMPVSETLQTLFQENGEKRCIPLSKAAYVVIESNSKKWHVKDGDNKYKIEKVKKADQEGESLKISFEIPQVILRLTAEIVKDTNYVFEPTKHYNHWHVDFCDENYARFSKKPGRWKRAVTSMVNVFERYHNLWLLLKIDLSPLIDFLENYSIDEKISSASYISLWKVPDERDDLIERCRTGYMKKYEERFGVYSEGNRNDLSAHQIQNHTISEAIARHLFSVYQLDSDKGYTEFIKPMVSYKQVADTWNSQPLRKAITISRKVINVLKPHLLAHKLVEEKDFRFFEPVESDELPDSTDEEIEMLA